MILSPVTNEPVYLWNVAHRCFLRTLHMFSNVVRINTYLAVALDRGTMFSVDRVQDCSWKRGGGTWAWLQIRGLNIAFKSIWDLNFWVRVVTNFALLKTIVIGLKKYNKPASPVYSFPADKKRSNHQKKTRCGQMNLQQLYRTVECTEYHINHKEQRSSSVTSNISRCVDGVVITKSIISQGSHQCNASLASRRHQQTLERDLNTNST